MKKPNSIAGSDILLFHIVFLILYSFFYFFQAPHAPASSLFGLKFCTLPIIGTNQSVSTLKKVKREAAAQRRPDQSKRKKLHFFRETTGRMV